MTLLGTPVAIRVFRAWGWGQRIREDGPHTHLEKVGTPTMGGIVMLVALVVAYLATRPTIAAGITFSPAGLVADPRRGGIRRRWGSSTTT